MHPFPSVSSATFKLLVRDGTSAGLGFLTYHGDERWDACWDFRPTWSSSFELLRSEPTTRWDFGRARNGGCSLTSHWRLCLAFDKSGHLDSVISLIISLAKRANGAKGLKKNGRQWFQRNRGEIIQLELVSDGVVDTTQHKATKRDLQGEFVDSLLIF